MNIVVLRVGFDGAGYGVVEVVVIGTKPTHIEPPHIPFGVPIDDPFRHHLADAARSCETMRAEGAGNPEALDGGRSEQEFAVGGEAFGTVEQFDDFRIFHGWHAADGVFHQRGEAIPVGVEQLIFEVFGDAVQAEGGGLTFVAAGDDSAHFLAPVDQQVGVAQVGEAVIHARDGLGHDVKMRHRDDGQVQADHLADFTSPHA